MTYVTRPNLLTHLTLQHTVSSTVGLGHVVKKAAVECVFKYNEKKTLELERVGAQRLYSGDRCTSRQQ